MAYGGPGELTVMLMFGDNLKDRNWIARQDPYCIITCGNNRFRSKTCRDGGRRPVWEESFRFEILNENEVRIECKDDDVMIDEIVGWGNINLTRVREFGQDTQQVPMMYKDGRQEGFIEVQLTFNRGGGGGGYAQPGYAPQPGYMPQPGYPPQPMGGMPAPGYNPGYGAPPGEVVVVEEHHRHHHHNPMDEMRREERREERYEERMEERRW